MAQVKTYSFTSAASPVNEDIEVGFQAARVEVFNETGQGSSASPGVVKRASWSDTMADGEAVLVKNTDGAATDTSSFASSAGISNLSGDALYGSAISAFTNANPGVITVADAAGAGFAVGDVIKVARLADDQSGTSLNGSYTIASISGNALTTATNTSSYSVYVSGGNASRVTDVNGDPVATENLQRYKVRIGTGIQAASSVLHVVIYGKEAVV